ncbi:MAG: hypothetical protein RLY86_1892 [Pseudomonadota bacterium]|jgi:AcrR family transcriptional regulator
MTEGTQRRRRRKDERPAELVAAGLAEFALNGFAATRLDDVARRAGVAKGTIYRYFTSKEDLFLAALRENMTPTFVDLERFVDGFEGTTRELLVAICRTLHSQMTRPEMRPLLRIIIAEGEKYPDLTRHHYEETVSKGRAMLEKVVARGRARGEVRDGAAADLPLVLAAPAVLATLWQMLFQPVAPIAPSAFLEAHIDLIVHGLLIE